MASNLHESPLVMRRLLAVLALLAFAACGVEADGGSPLDGPPPRATLSAPGDASGPAAPVGVAPPAVVSHTQVSPAAAAAVQTTGGKTEDTSPDPIPARVAKCLGLASASDRSDCVARALGDLNHAPEQAPDGR